MSKKILTVADVVDGRTLAVAYGQIAWNHVWTPSTSKDVPSTYDAPGNGRLMEDFGNPLDDLLTGDALVKFREKQHVAFSKREVEQELRFPDTKNGLAARMYDGWADSEPFTRVAPFDDVSTFTADDAIARRREQIEIFRAVGGVYVDVADVAERLWFPGGEPIIPICEGIEGFRRSIGYLGACYYRSLDKLDPWTWSVRVRVFPTMLARLLAHTSENEAQDQGRMRPSAKMRLLNCTAILKQGGREVDLLKAGIPKGEAQRATRVYRLGQKFPSIKLVERCLRPDGDGKYSPGCPIPYVRLDKEQVQTWLKGKGNDKPLPTAKSLESAIRYLIVSGRPASAIPASKYAVGGVNAHNSQFLLELFTQMANGKDTLLSLLNNADTGSKLDEFAVSMGWLAPVDDSPVEPDDEASADEASADEASADEASADEASADEASADEASAKPKRKRSK